MAEQIIDLNNKTPQELVKVFFEGCYGDDNIFSFKYDDKVRVDILDNMTDELRQFFLNDEYAQREINFDVQNLSLTDNVVRKMIQKQVINWNHFSNLDPEAKLRLLKEENLDFISDLDKDILRQLAAKNPLDFLDIPIAYRKILNDKLGLGLNYDESFENSTVKENNIDKLNNLQSEMWGFMSPSSIGYCWANATWQAVHKTYPDTNQVKKYAADIKAKFPYAYDYGDGYSGEIVYSCLYESQKTDKPIASFDLTQRSGNSTEMCMKTVLHKSGKTWSNGELIHNNKGKYFEKRDHALDFRDLIKAVIDDNCPVVVGKGNHAQYLGEGMDKRKQFLRCAVRFLYSKKANFYLLGYGISGVFNIVDVADFAISDFLAELLFGGEKTNEEAIDEKINNALENIQDPVFMAYEKINFGKFFCEEFIKLYIDERDKNKELYPDPNDLIDAVLKDFVENHIDKKLFEEQNPDPATNEKPEETTDQNLEHKPDLAILNNKTPQELVKIFFDGSYGDDEKFHFKYNDKVRMDILDNMTDELRQCFWVHFEDLIDLYSIPKDLSLADSIIKKMIQKRVINWNIFTGFPVYLKSSLLKEENLDFISDGVKDYLRQLAASCPEAFLNLNIAHRKILNDKLNLGLNYDEEFENSLIKENSITKLDSLQSEMWGFMNSIPAGYCWANATWQAVHKTYPDTNQVKKYAADVKAKYQYAYSNEDGSSGRVVYSCLYESQKTDKPIVSFDLTREIENGTEMCMKVVLHKSGRTCCNENLIYNDNGVYIEERDHALDFRELIKAVIGDICPVVVGKGNHAQYLGEDMNKRRQFLRCAVRFLYSKQVTYYLLDSGTPEIFYITQVANFAVSSFLAELLFGGEKTNEEAIDEKINNALENIQDPVFRCYKKIEFGKFFGEEFIRLYIDERDKNKDLYPDPNDLIDAVLKDFVENHIDKNLFEKEETEEKPVEPPKNDNEQQNQESQDKSEEKPAPNPDPTTNEKPKETTDQNLKHEPDLTKPEEETEKKPKPDPGANHKNQKTVEPGIDLDQKIDELSKTIKKSDEIKNLKANLESVGRFEDFTRSFKEAVIKNVKDIRDTFENYLKDTKKNPKPNFKKIKIQLKNYVELCYSEGRDKNEFMRQINDLDKVSTWQKFLQIIIGILTFDKRKILQPGTTKILAKVKKLASNDKLKLQNTKSGESKNDFRN